MGDEQKKDKTVSCATSCVQTGEKAAVEPSFWSINREMIRFKLHFFLLVGGLGTTVPFIAVLAKDKIGVSATSMAVLLSFERLVCIFTKPLIGFLADYFQKLKLMIYILVIVQVVSLFLLLVVPKIETASSLLEEVEPHPTSPKLLNVSYTLDECNNTSIFTKHMFKMCTKLNKFDMNICSSRRNDNFKAVVCKSLQQLTFDENRIRNASQLQQSQGNDFGNATELYETVLSGKQQAENEASLYACYQNYDFMCFLSSVSDLNMLENFSSAQKFNESFNCCICCTSSMEDISGRSDAIENHEKIGKDDVFITTIKQDYETAAFWMFAAVSLGYKVSINAVMTLSDTACCESVQKHNADYGRQRMWAAIGFGVMSPIGGILSDYTQDFLVQWCVMGAMTALAMWNFHKIELAKPHFSKNILKDVGTVIKSREFMAFELGVFMNGISMGLIWFYLIWFLTSIGGSRFLCGLVQTFECLVGDIPFMFFSGWFIKKLGHFNVLTMSLTSYIIRYFAYSALQNPWLVLPIECLHGLTYGAFFPAVASFGKLSAKPGTEATTQAILFSTHEGLGSGLGSILAGVGFDHVGGHQTFFYAGMVACLFTLISAILSLWIRSQRGSFKVPAVMEAKPYSSSFTYAQ